MVDAPTPPPSGIVVCPFEDRWSGACRALLEASFPTPDEADLVEEIRASGVRRVELIALMANRLIGHILISEGAIERDTPAWFLGPMAVEEASRRRGCGAALVNAACTAAERDRARPIFVLGSDRYYARFGFVPAVPLGYTSKFLTPDVPPECFMVRGHRGPGGGAVHYPAPFDRFA